MATTIVKERVWNKGKKVRGKDPDKYRKDDCGNIIFKNSYGKHTPMGWEIDHSLAKANGGTDHINNLRPLKTKTNRRKGAKRVKCA